MQSFSTSRVIRVAHNVSGQAPFRRALAPVLLTASVALLAGCRGGAESQGAAAAGPPPPMPVELQTLVEKPVERTGEFVGTLKSLKSMQVQPQAEGFLKRILVTSGQQVRPGTPMFEIDATPQQATVSMLEAQRAARQAELDYARQQADRVNALLAAGAVAKQELDQAQSALRNAEAMLKATDDQIRQQQAELAYYRVTAQIPGMVGDVPVRVGDRVTRSTLLTTVEDNSGLEAHINVPVQEAPALKLNLPVRIVDDAGKTLATTRIAFISPSVDDATQTVLVKAPVGAGDGALRAAQFVRARVVFASEPGLMVPVIAVQRVNNQYFVFVAEQAPAANGAPAGLVARQRSVTLGPVIGDSYVVVSGLKDGEQLILAGTQKIGDGAPVQAMQKQTPAPAEGRGGA